MELYTILFRGETMKGKFEAPVGFVCWATDKFHAETWCKDIIPDADILWVERSADIRQVYKNYIRELENSHV